MKHAHPTPGIWGLALAVSLLATAPGPAAQAENIPSVLDRQALSVAYRMAPPDAGSDTAFFWILSASAVSTPDSAREVGLSQRIDPTLQVTTTPPSIVYFPIIVHSHTAPALIRRYSNDPYYDNQWALVKVDAPAAWGISMGRGILIAVIDSGSDLDHPDLVGKVRTDIDWDFVNDDGVADDDNGHGTHVSGIAAAATDNGIGIASLGWEATILPLKTLGANGSGYSDDLAAAIRYAADHGARVINMSLGGSGSCPTVVQNAVNYAYGKGAVLVAAAGNNVGQRESFPADCTHVLGVAATNPDDSFASYSNYGSNVSVAAPGTAIYSTLRGGGYGPMSGTSMAAPHVTGLAALLYAYYPAYTPDQIASAILDNATDLGVAGWDEHTGCGRINAFKALETGARGASPLCLAGVEPWSTGAGEMPGDALFAPGEIIVSFQAGVGAEVISRPYGVGAEFLPALHAWRLQVPVGQEPAILAQLQADPAVAYADLNYLVWAQYATFRMND